ncbi:LANO_0G13146g1_1 [Lachancea nothofagi CBS 11611]|uniref:LANO_0G13146g1_1 n=1 Tax=Lachancea nothofagi CBS 11611 TaxID=1266666 RepID=A0A1G4KJW6_9SACH|nr:LANO_0G13146g1_1 [Lachancea nothofagi CBS 11611]
MNGSSDVKTVEKRLAVYNPDTQLNVYLNAVSEVSSLCFAALMGKLEDKHELSLDKIREWRKDITLKRTDAEIYLESEKLKVQMEGVSATENIDEIKLQMDKDLVKIRQRNEILRHRNEMLRAMNSHIDLVNEELEDMQGGRSRLSASQEEWEEQLGAKAVATMLRANIFKRQIVKVRDGEDTEYEHEELSVSSNFSRNTEDLRRTNDSMKGSVQRLQSELKDYQSKWLHNAGLFDKIADVLKDELTKRDLIIPVGPRDMESDERKEGHNGEQDEEGDNEDEDDNNGVEIDEEDWERGGDDDEEEEIEGTEGTEGDHDMDSVLRVNSDET